MDNLVLDYISYSENKINKKLIWDFIMLLILKKRDFLVNEVKKSKHNLELSIFYFKCYFLQMEFRLQAHLEGEGDDCMTEGEFFKAMEEFFFISDERQVRVSYRTALAHCFWDDNQNVVPVVKLAHIAAYYCLLQIVNEIQGNINKVISDSRKKNLENELKNGPGKKILLKLNHFPVIIDLNLFSSQKNHLVEYQDEFIKISDIDKLAVASKYVV